MPDNRAFSSIFNDHATRWAAFTAKLSPQRLKELDEDWRFTLFHAAKNDPGWTVADHSAALMRWQKLAMGDPDDAVVPGYDPALARDTTETPILDAEIALLRAKLAAKPPPVPWKPDADGGLAHCESLERKTAREFRERQARDER